MKNASAVSAAAALFKALFLEKILSEVDRYCMPSIRETVEFKTAGLGDDSILYGALSMITDK